ncbi:uncharacterized protein FFB20_02861 [Fusarium fujikuroi]|uniref:Uncharacterized protein n=2 Tax=Fusarium fujikuroi TaxID=5127 RepID=S0DQK1_GIBF5|nr:uncharacterized protein FFUJ_05160 [Fusarium fujikuroi IMI 58289]KLP03678.1 uncharacterized protein Y057_2834 [Fusarium fujikuroi]CCT63687.1 uncharacterized protein FFUJ_05160 [Fusarium fujikuroi IMI 58289]SCN68040.1 uncharacterized protein FFB20_02861 [Fusarium fujikuroi]SCN90663.1 uncharacterized protein FFE2_07049 [Fusarium fujikuroi]SCN98465.1 uncharacterized protein FFM5_06841 [Fusarium fujikuroi]
MDFVYQELPGSSTEKASDCNSAPDRPNYSSSSGHHRIDKMIKFFLDHPWLLLKDMILLSLAVPGFVALIAPSAACTEPQRAATASENQAIIHTAPLGHCNCGDSVAEAVEMGCKYDALAAAWLPDHCRDDALTAEFERMGHEKGGKWPYYSDQNLTKGISVEELGPKADEPGFLFYSTGEWHMAHCLFYWKKQYRARFNNVTVEPRYDNERHIQHCITVLLQPGALKGRVQAGVELASDYL